jgi:uncharacterized membrane protein
MRPRLLLYGAMGAYSTGFTALSLLRHRAFATGRFDLGNMAQAVWSTAHGHPLRITDLRGDQVSRLAAHADPILVLFAPLWWLWPSPNMLLTVQAIAVALGALPVFWLARKHLGSERAGLGFALAYLLFPAAEWLTLNEFHPVALACPLLLYAFWFLDENRLLPFAAFALLAALTKEEIPLAIAGFGLWYALAHRRRAGLLVAAAGAAAAALAIGVVIPHFNEGGASSFYSRYGDVGGSASGILRTAVTDPLKLLSTAFSERGLHYLGELLVPLGGLWLFAPVALLAAVPDLALNLLSATPTQTSIHFHYTAGAIPALVAASVLGAGRIARRRPELRGALGTAALLLSLAANYHLGAIPFWRELPAGEDYQAYETFVSRHDRIAARALRAIPAGDVVSATNSLGAHLSERSRILSFPYVQDATWVAADETKPGYADRIAPIPMAVQLVALRKNPAWKLVFEQDGVLVFQRATFP